MSFEGRLFWTEKITLGAIRDPLQLAVFRHPEEYFLTGIITQTERLRYYTFLTWAWTRIKEKKSDLQKNEILDLEKILTLASAIHHLDSGDNPKGIRSIDAGMDFLNENEKIELDKFTRFGNKNRVGWGNYYYRGSIEKLDILWKEEDDLKISPAAEEITNIFAKSIGTKENILWEKTFSKSDLKNLNFLCCCSLTQDEKNFWKMVLFGMTTSDANGLRLDYEKKLELINPDNLSFEKFQISEDEITESDLDEVLTDLSVEIKEDKTAKEMRTGSMFMLLQIIKDATPTTARTSLLQTIRDSIYYSQFQYEQHSRSIDFAKLDAYRKYWEVYVHNLYYIGIFEKILSIITEIAELNPLGIMVNELTREINSRKILDFIRKLGLNVNESDTFQSAHKKLEELLKNEKTTLSSPINEHKIIEKLIDSEEHDESFGLIFVLFLLCKYRFSFFSKNQLQILSYKQDKFASVSPNTLYNTSETISISDFPLWICKFVIKRHRHAAAKKLLNSGTKAWLFTDEGGELFFNEQYYFSAYRDSKWINVLEIMHDLGLVEKNSAEELWKITKDGEDWLKKIQ